MRIPCPFCGERGSDEFVVHGDATIRRPTDGGAAPTPAWAAYAYLRPNPAGAHEELWFHGSGCAQWLVVSRDTRTHAVGQVRPAAEAA